MDKTIFVLLDACQYAMGSRNLGLLEHMVDYKKAAKYKVQGELPSVSRSMYETLLTGLPVYEHGITCNEVVRRSKCENLFSLCKKNGGVTAAAAYMWMSELYSRAPFDRVRDRYQLEGEGLIDHGIFYYEDQYPDSHLFGDGDFLRETYNPDFLLIHSMNIDLAGHRFGSESREYADAVSLVGFTFGLFLPRWLEAGYQVVVTADHGMDATGIHCGTPSEHREVPLYIFSDKVVTGHFDDEGMITHRNEAPMLCRLLGIEKADGMIEPDDIHWK